MKVTELHQHAATLNAILERMKKERMKKMNEKLHKSNTQSQ